MTNLPWDWDDYPALASDVLAEIVAYLCRPHPDDHDVLEQYLTRRDPDPARIAPLLHDVLVGYGELDRMMDAAMHYSGVPAEEMSLRRLFSYVRSLGVDPRKPLLKQDANVYGWPREG